MDYTNLFAGIDGKKSKVGIIGATRGYGYTLLAQILHVDLWNCGQYAPAIRKSVWQY